MYVLLISTSTNNNNNEQNQKNKKKQISPVYKKNVKSLSKLIILKIFVNSKRKIERDLKNEEEIIMDVVSIKKNEN